MKTLLICPAKREGVAAFAEAAPLAGLPIFGKSLTEHWLEHFAALGAKEIFILAGDRPEKIRALAGGGARWGIRAAVFSETRELAPGEARAKYRANDDGSWLPAPRDAVLMDHLPGAPEFPLFAGYAAFFKALRQWLPRAATTPDRIGVREIQPGAWAGLRARVAPRARLRAPCWIGENVFVGADAVIGPDAILENDSFISRGAEISHSVVGAGTCVGEFTEIRNSIACGGTLINWQSGSTVKSPEDFLLCPLAPGDAISAPAAVFSRLGALLKSKWRGADKPAWAEIRAAR